ncbi:hypothetical protein LTR56_013033 [Elasticomyces elasticus]|nr:hypothetical protein LTR22_021974 [Elasticomyces elasticus]KAK3638561.1 hypothetical protein LTR56_013033 [Elasticomyces elasticus]KAK4928149.1 hypothetical protein LTR49_005087 [Elasticomyces elasticus]KAK5765901.1 hypothetical protein LTS12_003908 [Elasticomyces elasticus]
MWGVRGRIWAIDIWIKGSIVGIAVAPSFATYASTSSLEWPWVYHLSAILLTGVSFLFLWTKESRPSVLLKKKIMAVQKATGFQDLNYDSPDKVPNFRTFTRTMLVRPIQLFFMEPIVCAVSIMSAVICSSIYLQTEGLTIPYETLGYNERQISLVYFAWIVGLPLTIPLRLVDWHILSGRIRRRQPIRPEDKTTGFFVAAPVLAIALWWFAWTIPPYAENISPFVSITALVFVGACMNEFDGLLQGYLADAYEMYAASANAPLAVLRGILSGSFPIFAKQMFSGLRSNRAASILAAVATVFCGVAVWFWMYGEATREASPVAVSLEGHEEDGGAS